jgi:hypothetical protein
VAQQELDQLGRAVAFEGRRDRADGRIGAARLTQEIRPKGLTRVGAGLEEQTDALEVAGADRGREGEGRVERCIV